MKQFLILLLLLMTFSMVGKAQITVPTQAELEQFVKTKTIIMLEANPLRVFNEQMRVTADKHWKITPYEFMTYNDKLFDSLRTDPNLSFLILDATYFKRDKILTKYQFLNVSLGGNYATVKEMPTISGLPISYADVDEGTYDYKLGLILQFIESHVHNLIANPQIKSSSKALKFYSDNMKQIHNKTLYVLEEELTKEVNTLKKIKEFYPYPVKIATAEEIEAVIDSKDKNAVILHQVAPGKDHKKVRCWNTILGADDAALYYFNWFFIKKGKRAEGFSEKDFKKLSK
ncbi:MAG: hypothetical protein PHU27_12495 [Salinivirgaceae bacterium]|nr:hypothetical protein [Salinivirgaceae bacterium]MDD4747107.1 hypothetical protein [Salinivirgaceae bacterium]MDY0281089.1 hypothetical protein [Salinivirgaceae bacterium]